MHKLENIYVVVRTWIEAHKDDLTPADERDRIKIMENNCGYIEDDDPHFVDCHEWIAGRRP